MISTGFKHIIFSVLVLLLCVAVRHPVLAAQSTSPDKYMAGATGWFRPGEPLTFEEAGQIFTALGIHTELNGASPYAAVSRAAFLVMLHEAFPGGQQEGGLELSMQLGTTPNAEQDGGTVSFADVGENHWAWDAIVYGCNNGWVSGYAGGVFMPDQPISRAETAVLMQIVLGRTNADTLPDEWFLDVPGRHWASAAIYGAAAPPTPEEALDAYISDIIARETTAEMTMEEKRRAVYLYIRDHYKYLNGEILEKGAAGWEAPIALDFFKAKRGNCYSFAAGYGLLLRALGFEVNIISGSVYRTQDSAHGWAEIIVDGVAYIDDPELEMSYGGENSSVRFYNFAYGDWPLTDKNIPIQYRKAE